MFTNRKEGMSSGKVDEVTVHCVGAWIDFEGKIVTTDYKLHDVLIQINLCFNKNPSVITKYSLECDMMGTLKITIAMH